jgi:hypothetical protein
MLLDVLDAAMAWSPWAAAVAAAVPIAQVLGRGIGRALHEWMRCRTIVETAAVLDRGGVALLQARDETLLVARPVVPASPGCRERDQSSSGTGGQQAVIR